MSESISLAIPLTQVAYPAASVVAGYTLAGSFTRGTVMMRIISTLDQAVQISFDGVNDHVAVPIGSTVPVIIPFDFEANDTQFSAPNIFVKRIGTPTTGSLFVSAFTKS